MGGDGARSSERGLWGAAACTRPNTGAGTCAPGQSAQCDCGSGAQGILFCHSDGTGSGGVADMSYCDPFVDACDAADMCRRHDLAGADLPLAGCGVMGATCLQNSDCCNGTCLIVTCL